MLNTKVTDFGLQLLLKESFLMENALILRVIDRTSANEVFRRPLNGSSLEVGSGFLESEYGTTVIASSNFSNSISNMGILRFTGNEQVTLQGVLMNRLVGIQESATLYFIQNEQQTASISDSIIQNCFSRTSTVSLLYSQVSFIRT